MKLLLISDTHGHLNQIDALTAERNCDAIIHSGDFGFYDDQSVERLSERELALQVIHSGIGEEEKRGALVLDLAEKREFAQRRLRLSDLPQYLSGNKQFVRPIYAVWGNHEDVEVVRKFHKGEYEVPNLNVLHDEASFQVGQCLVVGLGGNLLAGRRLFQSPIAGGGGRIWSTLRQYIRLIEQSEHGGSDELLRIFVSHVSPGKEPLVSIVGAAIGASVIVSGHMGAPFTMCWNEFAIREPAESVLRLKEYIEVLRHQTAGLGASAQRDVGRLAELLERSLKRTVKVGRGSVVPKWYRNMHCVNLPDCDDGHAVLSIEDRAIHVEGYTAIKGRPTPESN